MKSLSLALAILPSALAATACSDNNCARAITGTRAGKLPIESRQADCAAYMTTTVYATPTATVTVTPSIVYNRLKKRDPVTITGTLPDYATNCPDAAAYSSVCSCWGFPATVVTVTTPTITVTTSQPTPTCAKGLLWGYPEFVRGDQGGKGKVPVSNGAAYADRLNLDDYKGFTPTFEGTKAQRFSVGGTACNANGHPIINGETFATGKVEYSVFQQRGYLRAPASGNYTVRLGGDDIVFFWAGPTAVSGWSVQNALVKSTSFSNPASAAFEATVGEYVAIRMMFINAQECAKMVFSLKAPDATVMTDDASTSDNTYIVSSCDGVAGAPGWKAWNEEA